MFIAGKLDIIDCYFSFFFILVFGDDVELGTKSRVLTEGCTWVSFFFFGEVSSSDNNFDFRDIDLKDDSF